MTTRLTEFLFALYVIPSGLPLLTAAAHGERTAAAAVVPFRTAESLRIPTSIGLGGPAGYRSGS
ncbi:hypothetical protein ACIQU4_28025 [Streptomyces sp. NPDC090741]|uniref:hypothetical protein n=1 Tax=Streptomyces sp. NPDC090741 TaxID=3365967 RepID=UPI0037F76538